MDDWSDLYKLAPVLLIVLLGMLRRLRDRLARERERESAGSAAEERVTASRSDEIRFERDYEPIEPR